MYLDLAESYLYIRAKVVNADGTEIGAEEDISTANFFIHSLFQYIEVYINGVVVSSKNYYMFIAYLLAQLSFSKQYKEEQLLNGLYVAETNAKVIGAANTGYAARRKRIVGSKVIELTGKLFDDLFVQTRYMPNIDVRIRLKRSTPEFCLLAPVTTSSYKIIIEKASFFARKHLISPKVLEIHSRSLDKGPYLYPFIRNDIKVVSIPANAVSSVTENIFASNRLPQRIFIGLLDANALIGVYNLNPYLFESFDLSNLTLSVDQNHLEYRNINLDFSSNYLSAFQSLLAELNLDGKSIGITRDSWLDGNVLFGFSLLGFAGLPSFNERAGSLKLEFTFSKPVPKAVVALVLSQTQCVLKIDKHHAVEIDALGIL
jgi:hypothetical protein